MAPFQRIGRAGVAMALTAGVLGYEQLLPPVMATQEVHELVPGVAIERVSTVGQTHPYRLTLKRGDLLRVTIEQKGIDVAVSVVGPDGRESIAVDAMDDEFRPEVVVAIADVDGVYTATVRSATRAVGPGRYVIRLDAPRPAIARDHIAIEAERAFVRGRGWRSVNNPTTWPGALAAFNAARDHYQAAADRPGEMKSLIEIAVTENYLSRPEALVAAEQAERLARILDDRPAVARVLRVNASIHSLAGNFAAAARAVEEATVINRAMGNRRAEANSLNYSGNMARRLNDLEKAIALYDEALPLARATNDRPLVANILNNLGIMYSFLGERAKAIATHEEALAHGRAAGDPRAQFSALNSVAIEHLRFGQPSHAGPFLTEALEIARQTGDKRFEALATSALGEAHVVAGDYAKALAYYRESAAIARGHGDPIRQAMALLGAGYSLHRLGETAAATGALGESLTIGRRLREADLQNAALQILARIERDRGELTAARRLIEEAIALDDLVREQMTNPELRASYVAEHHNKYELLIDVLQQLHAKDPDHGYAAEALGISERARARVLLESLVDARIDLRQDIDATLLEQERALQKQLNDASADLSRLLASGTRAQHAAEQTLQHLTAEYQKLQTQIREQSPHYAAITQPRALDLAEIRSAVLDDNTVLLEFSLGPERSWLWAVTATTLKSIELPPRREIDAAARSLYEQLTARQTQRGESSGDDVARVKAADVRLEDQRAAVSRMLLGGIARELHEEWRTKRLAIVAAGAIEYLPFAALPVPPRNQIATGPGALRSDARRPSATPLAVEHEIVSIPSASVLAVLRRETAGRTPAPRPLAIVADPVFDGTDPRVMRRPPGSPPVQNDTSSRAIDVMDSLYARGGLSRLPFSRDEAEAISTLARTADVFTAVDFNASRATVVGGALRGYRIVHLATHGLIDSERPALSSLVFSLVDPRGVRQNGYLRLADIYNLRLDAELVVLSACQTALGKEIRGEGLIGLTRAFIYAGAPRVVASLWQVSDLATAELMKKFYRGLLQQHLSPAAALRAAQVQMSRDPRWAAPYFWAGFVLQGEWR